MLKLKNACLILLGVFLVVVGMNYGIEMMAMQNEKSHITFSFGFMLCLLFPVAGAFILYRQKR